MIGPADAFNTYEYPGHYKILPSIHGWNNDPHRIGNGIKVGEGFTYCSDNNKDWMTIDFLKDWIKKNHKIIGHF